jgi:hypothetical protein
VSHVLRVEISKNLNYLAYYVFDFILCKASFRLSLQIRM